MEESRKKRNTVSRMPAGLLGLPKPVMIGIVVVCVVVVIWRGITYVRSSGSYGLEQFAGQGIWVKCVNPDCGAEYQMDMIDYFEYMEEQEELLDEDDEGEIDIPLICEKCGKKSAYKAIKCEKCEHVFFPGASGPDDFPDRCTECNYSEMEDIRRRARESR